MDARDVAYSSFAVSGGTGWQSTKQIHRMPLAPGPHSLTTALGHRLDFRVTATNTVEYEQAMEGTFTGQGTNTLAVHGTPISLDKSDVDYSSAGIGGAYQTSQRNHVFKLLPGAHYLVVSNRASFGFTVTPQGRVRYAPDLHGPLTGADTNTLALHGFPVTLDVSDVDYSSTGVGGTHQTTERNHTFKLLPGPHYVVVANRASVTFTVTSQGRVDYASDLPGLRTGAGTGTLAVHGLSIILDVTDIDYVNTTVGGVNWRVAQPRRTYKLLPGSNLVSTYNGINIPFTLTAQGAIAYEAHLEGLFTGSGSTTLTVHGFAVTLDTSDVDYVTNTVGGVGWKAPQSRRVFKLLPGAHVMSTYNGINIPFTVSAEGRVGYRPDLEGLFSGTGSTTLTVHGFAVTLDTSDVDYVTNTVGGVGWKAPQSRRVYKLLPGAHTFVTYNGIQFPFTVTAQGRVDYKSTLNDTFTGIGSATLAVRGHPITFDPRDSGHTSFGVSGVGWRGSGQLVTFRLVRGTHALHLPDGSKFTFQVTDTGKVDYDPSLDGVLSGRGSSTLAVHRRRQR
ncbi:hypothetical protein [Actinosynnema sp. ALI-1.44]|uniref:hypothetical protein n=1 Tax=Actinosynnema sp. ALI-1.44 TaxID=1933779 RepID=UPI001EDB3C5C|nr:hypothetical protein [Actinosynnema sp. ALI-1.44]